MKAIAPFHLLFLNLFLSLSSLLSLDRDPIADLMKKAIKNEEIPGGVVLITHRGQTIYEQAFGNRMIEPHHIPATVDGIYDLTSVTKLYTTALIMQLHDQKKVDITKPISTYLPSFRRQDKQNITLEHLLTHRSGLPIIIPTENFTQGLSHTVERIAEAPLVFRPGSSYLYSDLGTIVASYIAEIVAKKPFEDLLQEYIFDPLGLKNTFFRPPKDLLSRIAPTTTPEGEYLHGVAWSPRTRALGGVGGHSGLFAQAADIAVFGQLFLRNGELNGRHLLSAESIRLMTIGNSIIPAKEKRAIGFDIATDSAYARGRLFGDRSFGHTGVAGTCLWIDPELEGLMVVLTNRSHPRQRGSFKTSLAAISTEAARILQKKNQS